MPEELATPGSPASSPDPDTGFCALDISGPDAVAYLQSQLTSDLASTPPEQFAPAAWCNTKGNVDFMMLTARRRDRVTILLARDRVDEALRRLNLFRIGRNVEIGPLQPVRLVSADHASASASDMVPLSFDANRGVVVNDAPDPAGEPAEISLNDWFWHDIDAGMPWILSPNQSCFLPQMLDLERLGALSYRKGCFPGQEVIARVHYRGRLTRQLIAFEFDDADHRSGPGQPVAIDGHTAKVLFTATSPADAEIVRGLAVIAVEGSAGREALPDTPTARVIEGHRAVLVSDA